MLPIEVVALLVRVDLNGPNTEPLCASPSSMKKSGMIG